MGIAQESTASKNVSTFTIEAPQLKTSKKIRIYLPYNYSKEINKKLETKLSQSREKGETCFERWRDQKERWCGRPIEHCGRVTLERAAESSSLRSRSSPFSFFDDFEAFRNVRTYDLDDIVRIRVQEFVPGSSSGEERHVTASTNLSRLKSVEVVYQSDPRSEQTNIPHAGTEDM